GGRRDQGRRGRLQEAARRLKQERISMSVTLSESAARHVADFIAKRGKGLGIRLGVRTSGCSGMAYKLEFVDDAQSEDMVFESHGVKVVIDPKSLPYIDG